MSTYRTLADAMEAARALDRAERFAEQQRRSKEAKADDQHPDEREPAADPR